MLLSDGQGGTVDPLINLLPFLRLKGVEPFPSIAHPVNTGGEEGEVTNPTIQACAWSDPSAHQLGLHWPFGSRRAVV